MVLVGSVRRHAWGQGRGGRVQALWVREAQAGLLRDIRPNAVALVDGFGFEDYLLHSALGRRDGDVYRYRPPSHFSPARSPPPPHVCVHALASTSARKL